MKRLNFLTLSIVLLAGSAGMAMATPFADTVIAQLTEQGFANVSSETTWLGRVRITATRVDGQREIIMNPRTGEILRDMWSGIGPTNASGPIIDDVGETGRGASAGDGGSGDGGSGSDGSGAGSDGSGDGSHDGTDGGSDGGSGAGSSGSGSSGSGGSGSGGSGGGDDGGADGGKDK
jgi:hypothetical protein